MLFAYSVQSEDIFTSKPKVKKEMSVSKMKEELAHNYEQLLHTTTKSMKHLASMIDDIVIQIKQLAGEEQGLLYSADKQVIKQHQKKIEDLQEILENLLNRYLIVA